MDASKTEVNAFKVFSNLDFVDWSRTAPALPTVEEEKVVVASPMPSRPPSPVPTPPRPPTPSPRNSPMVTPALTPRLPPSPKREVFPREITPRRDVDPPEAPPAKRPIPRPRKYTASEENDDYEVLNEKEGILQDLLQMEKSGARLSRKWDIALHTLDELQFEYDRLQTEQTASTHVNYMKTGLQLGMSGLEVALVKAGVTSVSGWSTEACRDMTQYNRPLTRLYKKYWRTQHTGPVTELSLLIFGSLAWTVAKNNVMGIKPSSTPASSTEAPRMRPPPPPGGARGPSWNFSPPPRDVKVEEVDEDAEMKARAKQVAEARATEARAAEEKAARATEARAAEEHQKVESPRTAPKSTRSTRGRRRETETVLEL